MLLQLGAPDGSVVRQKLTRNDNCEKNKENFSLSAVGSCHVPPPDPAASASLGGGGQSPFIMTGRKLRGARAVPHGGVGGVLFITLAIIRAERGGGVQSQTANS